MHMASYKAAREVDEGKDAQEENNRDLNLGKLSPSILFHAFVEAIFIEFELVP